MTDITTLIELYNELCWRQDDARKSADAREYPQSEVYMGRQQAYGNAAELVAELMGVVREARDASDAAAKHPGCATVTVQVIRQKAYSDILGVWS